MTSDYELSQNFAAVLTEARETAGQSQQFMAISLKKSKNTISNWEKGLGMPNMIDFTKWFLVLGLNPKVYFNKIIDPENYGEELSEAKNGIIEYTKHIMSDFTAEQLHEQMLEKTGSSFEQQVNMNCIHNKCSMGTRVRTAGSIAVAYRMDKAQGLLADEDESTIDLESLDKAVYNGNSSVLNGTNTYVME